MTDAEWAQFQQLAATGHRAASIVEAADKLAEAVEKWQQAMTFHNRIAIRAALDAFKVVRNGQ